MVRRVVTWWRRGLSVRGGELAFAVLGLPLGVLGAVYAVAVLYAGALLSLTVLGLPFVAAALVGARGIGGLHRRLVGRLLGEPVTAPPPLPRPSGVLARGRVVLADPVAWRALLYLLPRLPLGLLGFLAAVGLPLSAVWLAGFPLWVRLLEPGPRPVDWLDVAGLPAGLAVLTAVPAALRGLSRANRALARGLLGPVRSQQRVRELENARATLLAESTDRLRRLERDLHDGTQAQLVALAITLSLADDILGEPDGPGTHGPGTDGSAADGSGTDGSGTDGGHAPGRAHTSGPGRVGGPGHESGPDLGRLRALVDRARGQTDATIAGLRRLTRGIHPVALDAGLAEALPTLTATSPVPVTVRLDLRERPQEVIERAVYFCAAELLTNLAKHSGARTAELNASAVGGRVRLTVRDDGRGGAAIGHGAGTGLAGLAERLAAVDGVLRVDSPPGGPTVVSAELPSRL
ncbi:sensor histidine kinase [Kitasatospora aureofaciens]|uniref:sensor histidine kinase n=1 Tax=Kitasatospora aureofaciens TaxID=1894 RepID=UPI0004C4F5F9|nr:sensor histidine kinase [Kitasatospora aureofaciens]